MKMKLQYIINFIYMQNIYIYLKLLFIGFFFNQYPLLKAYQYIIIKNFLFSGPVSILFISLDFVTYRYQENI